jgi:hypothetical protein
MANLGLGNRIELKRHLLSPDLVTRTTWDARIDAIGLGVALAFDKHCNRKFERLAGATDLFHSERWFWVLERYPVETITAIDQRTDLAAGWVSEGTVNSVLQQWSETSGVVQFPSIFGTSISETRITYTGGYWFDTAETEDTAQPAGSTKLPGDVKEAWFIQCKKVWEVYDPLGKGIAAEVGGPKTLTLAGLELVPLVNDMLAGHIRMNIS